MWYIHIDTTTLFDYKNVLLLIVSLRIYISYIFKYKLHFFLMCMNRTIHNTIRFMIQNLSSLIHDTIHNSTTRMKTCKPIFLKFWVRGTVNLLCVGWAHVSFVLCLPNDPLSKDPSVFF